MDSTSSSTPGQTDQSQDAGGLGGETPPPAPLLTSEEERSCGEGGGCDVELGVRLEGAGTHEDGVSDGGREVSSGSGKGMSEEVAMLPREIAASGEQVAMLPREIAGSRGSAERWSSLESDSASNGRNLVARSPSPIPSSLAAVASSSPSSSLVAVASSSPSSSLVAVASSSPTSLLAASASSSLSFSPNQHYPSHTVPSHPLPSRSTPPDSVPSRPPSTWPLPVIPPSSRVSPSLPSPPQAPASPPLPSPPPASPPFHSTPQQTPERSLLSSIVSDPRPAASALTDRRENASTCAKSEVAIASAKAVTSASAEVTKASAEAEAVTGTSISVVLNPCSTQSLSTQSPSETVASQSSEFDHDSIRMGPVREECGRRVEAEDNDGDDDDVEEPAEEEEEEPDPRIQTELEKLNRATDAINSMETELENCRSFFRKLLNESTTQLLTMSKKMSEAIEKSRPYYEASAATLLAQQETQQAATRFERANSDHTAAKEMVALAELGLERHGNVQFDTSWQETLNHATLKVNEAERERLSSQNYHLASSRAYEAAARKTQTLEKGSKRFIVKSRPYFDLKAKFTQQLEEEKRRVAKLEGDVAEAKKSYAESLRNLEAISDEIHHRRRQEEKRRRGKKRLGRRGVGVGAEMTPPATVRIETPSPSSFVGAESAAAMIES